MKPALIPIPASKLKTLARNLPEVPTIWDLGPTAGTPSRKNYRFRSGFKVLGLVLSVAWICGVLPQKPTVQQTATSQVAETSANIGTPDTPRPGKLARVTILTYCSSIPEGVEAYDLWTRNPEVRELAGLIRQFGGELVAPGQQLLVLENGRLITQLRTLRSKTICYLPTRDLR